MDGLDNGTFSAVHGIGSTGVGVQGIRQDLWSVEAIHGREEEEEAFAEQTNSGRRRSSASWKPLPGNVVQEESPVEEWVRWGDLKGEERRRRK